MTELTNGFGIMGDLLGPSKKNFGLGKRTKKKKTGFGVKTRLAIVFMHLWLIAVTLGLLSKVIKILERKEQSRIDKQKRKNTTIIDIEVEENNNGRNERITNIPNLRDQADPK